FDNVSGLFLLAKHMDEKPRPPREHVPDIPPDLERLVLALLEKDPALRPSAGRVASALDAIASGQALALGRRSRRAVLVGAGLALAVVDGVVLAFMVGQRGSAAPSPALSPSPSRSGSPAPSASPRDALVAKLREHYRGSATLKLVNAIGAPELKAG